MRVAFLSPMPPSKSGIADYSAALTESLRSFLDVTVFADENIPFDSAKFDLFLYQIGNNAHHAFVYETAIKYPGVVVMHEANLHHLLTELTIRRGNWEGYLNEVEYNGGARALAYARRVQALEVGPDYEGVAMTRRLLERSRAVIVHSRFMADQIRNAGFKGPVATIPHGAWIPRVDRLAYRHRLGLNETVPLVGIFGFLKPYKRIPESLRAFRRLLRVEPAAKLILVGEPHSDLPLESLIRTYDLSANARVMGYVPIEDFTGYLGACDVVLNLRYPTVGESSGSLLRALGLSKCVLVSDVGAFAELPEEICLKVPVDGTEEDLIYEYLNLVVSRPDLARMLGARARRWVEKECSWNSVARRYAEFLESVADGVVWNEKETTVTSSPSTVETTTPSLDIGHILAWTPQQPESREYVDTHRMRLLRTLEITPPGTCADTILEMGAYLQITPLLETRLGYGEVRGCYYGPLGQIDHKVVTSLEGERFECAIELFDAERDFFPYSDGYFSAVLCCELLEHLAEDPMYMMAEINRILKPGGHLVLTTPNIGSMRGIAAILQGYHPGFFQPYIRPSRDAIAEPRHNREYTPLEIHLLLNDAGFEVTLLETGPFREELRPELAWVSHLLDRYQLSADLRGDDIYAVGKKTGPVRKRYPEWLYSGPAQ